VNKAELVDRVAECMEATTAEAQRFVNCVLDCITEGLKKDSAVTLVNFGTFAVRARKARTGRNPRTGQAIQIRASRTVSFRAGKALKDAV